MKSMNEERKEWARSALSGHPYDEDPPTAHIDLLANLFHLFGQVELDKAIRMAREHYREEVGLTD